MIKQKRIPNFSTHSYSGDHHFGTGTLWSHSHAVTSYSRDLFQGGPLGPAPPVLAEPGTTWRDRMSGFRFRTAPGKHRMGLFYDDDGHANCIFKKYVHIKKRDEEQAFLVRKKHDKIIRFS